MKLPASSVASIALGLVLLAPAAGQTYRFTRLLENSLTLRPDGQPFGIGYTTTTPAFDGEWVVFRDPGPANNFGFHAVMWSINTLDGRLRRLVDLKTQIPGTSAVFQDLQPYDTAPIVRNGTVVFVARDSSSGRYRQGLYSTSAGGGPVQRIADYSTWSPSGGTFTLFDTYGRQSGAFSYDGTTVAFNAYSDALGDYTAQPDGTSLSLVADNLHPFLAEAAPVMNFYSPAIHDGKVVLVGIGAVDPRTGYSGIYLGTAGGNGVLTELVNSNQPLPGNLNPDVHHRFDPPILAFDGTLAVFRATDSRVAGFHGLYAYDLTSQTITTIADVNTELAGLGKLSLIASGGVAVSQGWVLFKAAEASGNSALYVWKDGVSTRVVGKGDELDGFSVLDITDPGPAALYGSAFVFNADFGRGMRGLYVATPVAAADQ